MGKHLQSNPKREGEGHLYEEKREAFYLIFLVEFLMVHMAWTPLNAKFTSGVCGWHSFAVAWECEEQEYWIQAVSILLLHIPFCPALKTTGLKEARIAGNSMLTIRRHRKITQFLGITRFH